MGEKLIEARAARGALVSVESVDKNDKGDEMCDVNYVETFKCKQCGDSSIEEVMTHVTVRSTVTWVGEDGEVDYANQANEDGSVYRYECEHCGVPIIGENDEIPFDGESLRDALKFRSENAE